MITHTCDSCGDEYDTKVDGQAACMIAVSPPRKPKDYPGPLTEWLARASGNVEEQKFDLCRECALAMIVALKQRRLDRKAGRAECQ